MTAQEKDEAEFELESAVRNMRDRVYGVPSSDENWNACKHNWLTHDSVKWLEDTLAREQTLARQ